MRAPLASILAVVLAQTVLAQDAPFGKFTSGPITVTFLSGPRNERRMRLMADVRYEDPGRTVWVAESGFVTDGASIPRALWSFVGGPFDGPYRDAAIVHDKYCDARTRPWRDVHRMFYTASRAAGVAEVDALLLYGGVMLGGPRWPDPQPGVSFKFPPPSGEAKAGATRPIEPPKPKKINQKDLVNLKAFINRGTRYPSLDEIDARVLSGRGF